MVCFTDREIRMIMNDMEEETQSLGYAPLKIEELSQNLQEACFSANWKTLMPVQAHSLPYTLKGYDVMVQSQTGSGKTGAAAISSVVISSRDRFPSLALLFFR